MEVGEDGTVAFTPPEPGLLSEGPLSTAGGASLHHLHPAVITDTHYDTTSPVPRIGSKYAAPFR